MNMSGVSLVVVLLACCAAAVWSLEFPINDPNTESLLEREKRAPRIHKDTPEESQIRPLLGKKGLPNEIADKVLGFRREAETADRRNPAAAGKALFNKKFDDLKKQGGPFSPK